MFTYKQRFLLDNASRSVLIFVCENSSVHVGIQQVCQRKRQHVQRSVCSSSVIIIIIVIPAASFSSNL